METAQKSVKFDPGFAQHTTILSISAEYIYSQLEKFKNFGQKKMKFKMLSSQLVHMAENNVGFCLGCLLWAVCIKSEKEVQITGNPCLGDTFNKDETVEEIDYSIEFFNRLSKDFKYYLNESYTVKSEYIKYLELYKEFLLLNMNFVNTKTTDDLILPEGLKIPEQKNIDIIKEKIESVVKSGDLLDLEKVFSLVYNG